MNTVILVGRLASEPELRYTPSGHPMCSFILAVGRQLNKQKKEEYEAKGIATADFPRINSWGKTAEHASGFLKKGQRIAVEGSLQTGCFEKNGVKVYTCDVIATNIEYLDRAENQQTSHQEKKHSNREEVPLPDNDDFMSLLNDDEDPF